MSDLETHGTAAARRDAMGRWLRLLLIWLILRGTIAAGVGFRIVVVESHGGSINEGLIEVAGFISLGILATPTFRM